MVKAEVVFDGDLIYCNGLVIQKGPFQYFVENSNYEIVKDYCSLEDAIKYCLEN